MDTILGKGKKDISMLMTYEAMESYLKDGGRLAFVITQSVFKTAGAGQGFRRFRLGSGTPICPVGFDDLSSFQCFEGATNRTAVVVLQKGREVHYPVNLNYWQKTAAGKAIGYDAHLQEVISMTRRIEMKAAPVDEDDFTSPWLTARPKALKALRKVIGPSDYRAYEGVNTGGANGVFWLEILDKRSDGLLLVRNITEGAKREVEPVTATIEPDLVYPLLRGRDVQRWQAVPSAHILMVQDPKTRRGIDEETMQEQYPRTWEYLFKFKEVLRSRAAFKRYFTRTTKKGIIETAPFYSMFNVGSYTFSPYKIVWREQSSKFIAAPILMSEKTVMPDHKLMMVPLENKEETYYLLSILLSSPARLSIEGYSMAISTNTHVLNNISISKYNADNDIIRKLSKLGADFILLSRVEKVKVENLIDQLSAQLWGITDAELKDIQWNLADLKTGGRKPKQAALFDK
jgi:hypothetical protein